MSPTTPPSAVPDPSPVPSRTTNLGRKAAQGSLWTVIGFGAGQVLRLGSNLVLTRLLAREAFGIMLLVMVVLQAISLFGDIGIGPSIVQNRREDPRFLNTAWTIQILRGLLLSLVAVALAWPMALFFDQPVLVGLIAWSGLGGGFMGLRSSNFYTANRNLALGRITLMDLAARFIGSAVTIAWALVSPTVWALAVGGVTSALATAVLSHVMLPGVRNRLTWDRDSVVEIFGFGKWVFVSTLLGFLATQTDRIVFGKLVPVEWLGVYAIAILLAGTPQEVFRRIGLSVDFPLYCHTIRTGGDLPDAFRRGRRRILVLAAMSCALLIACGPALVAVLYETPYAAAGWMVQLLAVGTWWNAVEATVESVLLAQGRPQSAALASLAKVVAMIVLLPLGFVVAGFAGAIAGFSMSELARLVVAAWAVRKDGLHTSSQSIGYSVGMFAFGAVGYGTAWLVGELGLPAIVQLAVAAIVVVGAWTIVARDVLLEDILLGKLSWIRARRVHA